MTIYLCSNTGALAACLAAQPTTASVGLLTTATQPPIEVAVRWTAVATITNQPEATSVAALQACACIVVAADLPVSSDAAQQSLCAAIAALATHDTTLIFAASAAPLAGLCPGIPAASLLPDTIIGGPRRLLVLEGGSYIAVTLPQRTITVHGGGCVLVVTLPAAGEHESTRLMADVLTAGMSQDW
jgi:hypothetical protein